MAAKAQLTHPSHQGVCGRHGTEDLGVTPGDLMRFPDGTGISAPISRKVKGEVRPDESSDSRIVPEALRKRCHREDRQPGGLGKAAGKGSGWKPEREISKGHDADKFLM